MNPLSAADIEISIGADTLLPIQNGTLTVGAGWEVTDGVDLDVSAVCFSNTGSIIDAAYYNNLKIINGNITHSGDIKKGEKSGFDEEITVSLDNIMGVSVVMFFLSAHSGGTFKNCESAMIEVLANGESLVTFTASGPQTGNSTGLMMGMLFRNINTTAWHFQKVMRPVAGRHFAACLMPMRKVVDSVLDPGAVGERQLVHDKTFDMQKGDQLMLPSDAQLLTIGLGWTAKKGLDLDASCIYLDDVDNDGDMDPVDIVYFGQKSKQGVRSTGDNLTGEGKGDDEQILVNLGEIPEKVSALAFVVTIYTANGSFRDVTDSYVRLFNSNGAKHEFARYKLTGNIKSNAVVFAILSRDTADRNKWVLLTLGQECDGRSARFLKTDLWDGMWDGVSRYQVGGSECCTIS